MKVLGYTKNREDIYGLCNDVVDELKKHCNRQYLHRNLDEWLNTSEGKGYFILVADGESLIDHTSIRPLQISKIRPGGE